MTLINDGSSQSSQSSHLHAHHGRKVPTLGVSCGGRGSESRSNLADDRGPQCVGDTMSS